MAAMKPHLLDFVSPVKIAEGFLSQTQVCDEKPPQKKTVELDDRWPESEKGDVTAALNMMITRQQTKYFNVISRMRRDES